MKTYNKHIKFIYDKPKKIIFVISLYFVVFTLFILLAMFTKIYNKVELKGIVLDNKIIIPSTLDNISLVSKSKKIKIDNKYYKFKILEYSEVYNDGNINLQDVTLSSNIKNKSNNQVVEITFYYNYERLFKKLLRGVLK